MGLPLERVAITWGQDRGNGGLAEHSDPLSGSKTVTEYPQVNRANSPFFR
jgi:hypothetical protein